MSKYRIAVIVPYFGDFPDYFAAWKISAYKNASVDFLIFTDDKSLKTEKNIIVNYYKFTEFVDKLGNLFKTDIVCKNPYKLCDYRPTFGEVFKDLLVNYDFWGYCDIDLVFGNISHFITDEILTHNDRIFINGHLSLYRNNEKMNNLFLSEGTYPEYNAVEAFSTNEACYFDEFRGMELKCIRNNISLYKEHGEIIDLNPANKFFYNNHGERVFFLWENGELYALNRSFDKEEILYVHFQKRQMKLSIDENNAECFVILPGIMSEKVNISAELFDIQQAENSKIRFVIRKLMKAMKRDGFKIMIKRNRRKRDVEKYKKSLLM